MDMDAILESQRTAPKPSKIGADIPAPQRTHPNANVNANPKQVPAAAARKDELQPGQDWANPATKKKQKVVLLAMLGVGAALLIGALTMYALSRPKVDDEKIAVVDPGKETPKPVDPQPIQPAADGLPDDPANEETPTQPEPLENELEDPDKFEPEPMEAPPIVPSETESTTDGFGDDSETDASEAAVNTPQPPDKAGTVKAILAESGTSILQIRNAASNVRNDFAIGTPRYYFEKIRFEPGNPTSQKDQVLLGVGYRQQTLQTVLHELAAISGLRLTIDAPAITLAGAELNPNVEIQVENETTATVIRKVAESVNLEAFETDHGYLITAKQDRTFRDAAIDVAVLVENEKDGVALADTVRQMIWPGSWHPEPPPPGGADPANPKGTCRFADGKIQLGHAPVVIGEVEKLIDGLKALAAGKPRDSKLLGPVPWIDAHSFKKPFQEMNSVRVPLGKFFRTLHEDHDVRVLGDWHSLGNSGWTSDAMAPSRIVEPTVGDVVRETAHGLGASIYVVDERTVWITAPGVANNIFVLKVYPLAKIADGRLSADGIESILRDAVGDQLAQPGVAFSILAKQKVMILRASQMLHRQVHAVVEQLD